MSGFLVRLIGWLTPLIFRFLRMLFFLATTAVTSIFVGVPRSVERIADTWTEEATNSGVPANYHPSIRRGAMVVASITLILGWLVLASLTVFLLRLIF